MRRIAAHFWVLSLLLGTSCALPKGPRSVPHGIPPRVVAVSLDGVRLQASAYMDLFAWLDSLAVDPDAEGPRELDDVRARWREARRDEAVYALSARRLSACEEDACARGALQGTSLAAPFASAWPWFFVHAWNADGAPARDAMTRLSVALPADFPRAALDVVRALDIEGDVPLRVDVAARAAPSRTLPALAASGYCTRSARGAVECALDQIAWRATDESALARAIFGARAKIDAAGVAKTERVWGDVRAFAVAAAMDARYGAGRARLREAVGVDAPAWAAWLEDAWPARAPGEDPAVFAARAVEACAARAP